MGGSGISKSQVSRLCGEIDDRVKAFLDRPIEGDWPYVWLDATYVKVRRNHRIVSVEFLRKLRRRGLRGTKLVISDAHEGIKAAVTKLVNATWQRCRVHTMRNALAHAGKSSRRGRRGLHEHRFRPGNRGRRQDPMAQDRRSTAPDAAKAGTLHGLSREADQGPRPTWWPI